MPGAVLSTGNKIDEQELTLALMKLIIQEEVDNQLITKAYVKRSGLEEEHGASGAYNRKI